MLMTAFLSDGARVRFRVDETGVEKSLAFCLGRNAQKRVKVYDGQQEGDVWHFRYTVFARNNWKALYEGTARVEG